MPTEDNANSHESTAKVAVVDESGIGTISGETDAASLNPAIDAAVDGVGSQDHRDGSGSGGTTPEDDGGDAKWLAAVGIVFWPVVGIMGILQSESTRAWLGKHTPLVVVGLGVLIAVIVVAILAMWTKRRDTTVRAAALMLVGFPAILIALASVLFVLPPLWQLNTVRSLVVVILFVTPAVMWWLFLAAQRASLLNEFLTNLQRLGLLDVQRNFGETEEVRKTRIGSYLQRFEGTYGRLPQKVHDDVIEKRFQPYSSEEARGQTPISIAAVPVSIAVVLFAVGWLLTLPPVDQMPSATDRPVWVLALTPNATPVTFAFLGAYFFSIQMLFRRYVRSDLRGSAYIAVVMRTVLAVIGIWVLEGIAEAASWQTSRSQMLLLGFAVGVFPVVVWQIIRSVMIKVFRYAMRSLESQLPLDGLDGLTVWHESRLEEEDIENIPNMATADVVDLLVRTRLPAERIVDWVDQAILLTYLGPEQASETNGNGARRRLARHGVRSASSLLSAAEYMRIRGEFGKFAAVIEDKAGLAAVASLLAAIRTSSNLTLVLRWRGMEDGASDLGDRR